MRDYCVSWIDKCWKKVTIEARNIDEAKAKFWDWDFDEKKIEVEDESVEELLEVEEA